MAGVPAGYHPPVMERTLPATDGPASLPLWQHSLCALAFLGLLAWQVHMTLGLFGPDRPWQRLLDDQPLLSGAHPLHLYFGYLGARAFAERGTLCCYDPAFQAGYPKTPVFDSGSRPAELFVMLAGADGSPAAYKIGLAACCVLGPFVLALAARCLGLGRPAAWLAAALGVLVWWGGPCRESLEAGDLDALLAGLAALAGAALLARFDRTPDLRGWLGLLLSGWVGWFTQPFLFVLTVPLVLVYYLSVGPRHRLGWHMALGAALAGSLAGNAFWLSDWVMSWWIRRPVQFGGEPLSHRTIHTVWDAPLWGGPADRTLAVALLALAFLGVVALNEIRQRAAARVFGLGAGGFLVLAVLGLTWRPLSRLGTSQLVVPAVWFAIVPAVYALAAAARWASCLAGGPWRGALLAASAVAAAGAVSPETGMILARQCATATPLEVGLGNDRGALVTLLRAGREADGRVLLEDRPGRRDAPHWTALLPRLTGRSYLGGLDPEGWIEHSVARLSDGVLAGRPIADWTDAQLTQFCRRYHVGSVACWSPAAIARFRAWPDTVSAVPVADSGPGVLFTLRPTPYVLRGAADVSCVDRQRIVLDNVTPEDGLLILSQHYQAGMQAWPPRVQVERDPDPTGDDPIPFIRLRLSGPVVQVVLTWDAW